MGLKVGRCPGPGAGVDEPDGATWQVVATSVPSPGAYPLPKVHGPENASPRQIYPGMQVVNSFLLDVIFSWCDPNNAAGAVQKIASSRRFSRNCCPENGSPRQNCPWMQVVRPKQRTSAKSFCPEKHFYVTHIVMVYGKFARGCTWCDPKGGPVPDCFVRKCGPNNSVTVGQVVPELDYSYSSAPRP